MSKKYRSSGNSRRSLRVDAFRTRLWPVPALGTTLPSQQELVCQKSTASWARTHFLRQLSGMLFGGGGAAAREVLSAIASTLITVTSLTVVTLQLASSQFSPRLLRTFARDLFVQRTIGDTTTQQAMFVPKLSVTVAYFLAIAASSGWCSSSPTWSVRSGWNPCWKLSTATLRQRPITCSVSAME